jgi:hypothetical protein
MPWITRVHRCATPESNCGRRWTLQHDPDTDVLIYVEIESP